MSCRVGLLEAALNHMEEAVVILDDQSNVLFWNKAATDFTGYPSQDVLSHPFPDLYRIGADRSNRPAAAAPSAQLKSPTLVTMSHKLGYSVPGMLRRVALDAIDEPSGEALLFYPIEELDALPHGDSTHQLGVERSQADMHDRLEAAHHQWLTNRLPFGLLWITVDQAEALRVSHGSDACEAMLRTVEHTLLRQMKPAEIIGRWGDSEFLVVAHERTVENLIEHAQRLAGIARTADFRWWGDRVELTVSIGVSIAAEGLTLQSLLNSARGAMHAAIYAGGNQAMEARGI
ncbi:MAG TPA: diguanylate cyclase [Acidobacteriaceae bacterium]|nr:diguanylate cyclase [Acidobacteriaceae bacterium]